MDYQQGPTFASLLTRRVQWVLGVLVALWIVGEGVGEPAKLAALAPIGAGFRPWQPLTASFFQGSLGTAFFGWVMVLFLTESTWKTLGTRKLLLALGLCWALATSAIVALGAFWKGQGSGLVYGPFWLAEAMVVWVALQMPNARFALLVGTAIPAMWVVWAFGAFSLVRAVVVRDLSSVYQLFAWAAAWSIVLLDEDRWRRWRLVRRKKQIEKELSRFTVLEGGKGDGRREDRLN